MSMGLLLSCTAEDIKNAMDQIKTDEQGKVPGLVGTYALDDGNGLTDAFISFDNEMMYEYKVMGLQGRKVFAEGYLWYTRNTDFSKQNSGNYSVSGDVLYCNGIPYGKLQVETDKLVLDGKTYTKFIGVKAERYSTISVQGELSQSISYMKQTLEFPVSVDRTIPSGRLMVDNNYSWVSSAEIKDGILTLNITENNSYSARMASIVLSYVGASDVQIQIQQLFSSSSINTQPASQDTDYTGGEFSFTYTVENPRESTEVTADTQNDWITDVKLEGNTVSYKVAENNSGSSRTGYVRLSYGSYSSISFPIHQSYSSSVISFIPESQTVEYTSGSYSFEFSVSNPRESTSFSATSQNDWITDVKLEGNAVSYKVKENNSGSSRTGKIKLSYGSIASNDFSITQNYSAPAIAFTPSSQSVEYTGGSYSFSFSISNPREGIACTAASQSDWITDVKLEGNTVSYKVAENNSGSSRTGKIKLNYGSLASNEFSITQNYSAPEITFTPTEQALGYAGGGNSFSFSISNPREGTSCLAASQNDWITDVKLEGHVVSYKVKENNSGSSRTGKIKLCYGSLASNEFLITQNFSAPAITFTPSSQSVEYSGGGYSFSFTIFNPREGASCTAASQHEWITDVKLQGTTVSYKVKENNSVKTRDGAIMVSYGDGNIVYTIQSFNVAQSNEPISQLSLNKTTLALNAGAGETLVPTVTPSDAILEWSSSDTHVATVKNNGIVTAVGNGTAIITLKALCQNGSNEGTKTVTCTVAVTTAVTGVSLNKSNLVLTVGTNETLMATISPSTASNKTLAWSSSNTNVVSVNQNGNVLGLARGTATIIVTTQDGGKSATCSVNVYHPMNLSANGCANCYIVSSAGDYSFCTTQGNSTSSVGSVSSVAVLWESYGTSTTPSVGSVINNVTYSDNTIFFSTPSTLENGNAVIAAKTAGGRILWSWHIWVCKDYAPNSVAQVYNREAGTMMDRNLGATSATPGDVGALGLLYQWGRKDPFLGSSSISSNAKTASTLNWPSYVESTISSGTISYAIAHPTTFIAGESYYRDWVYSSRENTLWNSSKTIYDPCPPGWRVPDGGPSGVWSKAANNNDYFSYNWDNTNKGMNFSGKFGNAGTIWYPAAGNLDFKDGSIHDDGIYTGVWWSCTPNGSYAYSLFLNSNNRRVYTSVERSGRADGYSVRCLQE